MDCVQMTLGSLASRYGVPARLELELPATPSLELDCAMLLELDSVVPLEPDASELDEIVAASELDSCEGATPYRGCASSSEEQLTQKRVVNASAIFFQCL